MAESIPVRCPACLRENGYTPPVFPCACGSPVTPPLDLDRDAVPLTHRTWTDSWVAVRCGNCGRESEWPQPELGCASCGTVARLPVHAVPEEGPDGAAAAGPYGGGAGGCTAGVPGGVPGGVSGTGTGTGTGPRGGGGGGPAGGPRPPHVPQPHTGPAPRPPFRPVTIRTARDAVATAALYLRWLGFRDVRQPDTARPVPSAAVDLHAPGLVAQVDPTTAPADLRAVECVWLNGLTASATSVYFALAGYTEEARARADELGIPLFVMDLTGMPQPLNDPADELVVSGTGT
ncbi:hypothetical protein [Streptomyces sp. NPDC012888]|uniref:hypothetical protein n=1 Tax=Streptomyces sp. NPDC012888 TaxID=3364855 RepID=UPI0036ADE596